MVCFLLITPLATISGWLCLRGAMDHLHLSSRLEAVGLIALTVALFTIYLFWTLVSMLRLVSVDVVQCLLDRRYAFISLSRYILQILTMAEVPKDHPV